MKPKSAQAPKSVWSTPETTTAMTASALDPAMSVDECSLSPVPMTQTNSTPAQTVSAVNLSHPRSASRTGVQRRRAETVIVDIGIPAGARTADISVARHSQTNATWTPNISISAADEEVGPQSLRTVDSVVSRITPPRQIAARRNPRRWRTAPVEMIPVLVVQPSRRVAISTKKRCSSVDLARVHYQGLARSVRLVAVLSRKVPMMSVTL